jgi:hypothetical protein
MKSVVAVTLTTAALLTGCGGNTTTPADPTAAFLAAVKANQKSAGIDMPPIPEDAWKTGTLIAGHQFCDMAAQGKSRDEIVTAMHPDAGEESVTSQNIEAAETYLCPEYKGH